ncbi:uncharacterized protein LOC117649641 [Thrips palmi]|uniref:Uncharacterized protein LOC117649641 n=1 Tax=Thrips palmi TaxID=161013 RepID=A0A6P8ZT44_THRPL|nr:uncharacterized protein LOC117649641 [Thrips palmi]
MNGKKYIEGSVFQGLIFALTLLIGVLCETSRGPARGRLPQCPRTASASGVRLIYEHPFHCTKFIECWGAQRTVKDCPPGTAFSKRLRACDHFHNVDECGVSGYSICQGVKDYECGKAPASFHHVPNSNRLDNEAAKNFPWHAAIYRKERGKFQHVCGGALILPNLVLTAFK